MAGIHCLQHPCTTSQANIGATIFPTWYQSCVLLAKQKMAYQHNYQNKKREEEFKFTNQQKKEEAKSNQSQYTTPDQLSPFDLNSISSSSLTSTGKKSSHNFLILLHLRLWRLSTMEKEFKIKHHNSYYISGSDNPNVWSPLYSMDQNIKLGL